MDKKYNIILADPPWQYNDPCNAGKRGAVHKYPVLTVDDICKLNVSSIADKDSILFLWTTFPQLAEALQVINSWGFTYKTNAFTWVKTNKINQNSLFWGMGRWTRSCAEICLLATKGKPKRVSASVHSVVMTPIEGHSKKPDCVKDKIVQLCGDLPRIELFSRQETPGWDCLGNAIDGKDIREILK